MSGPPPPVGGTSAGGREYTLALGGGRRGPRLGRRRDSEATLRLTPAGAVIEQPRSLDAPLRLALGQLHLGAVDPGSEKASGAVGRFPVLKRISATAVVPREEGIEGWLWTSTGGTALVALGDPDEAPNGALLFTKPLGADVLDGVLAAIALAALAARSPLGQPAALGVVFRFADPLSAENALRAYGLLRPLTDREVPPTMRRALPTDKPADPTIGGGGSRASGSVAPPGFS